MQSEKTSPLASPLWNPRRMQDVPLREDTIVVWSIRASVPVRGALTRGEAEELAGRPPGAVTEGWRRARVGLRMILSGTLRIDPLEVELERDGLGKPRLVGGEVEFNLAHSGGDLLVAVSRSAVGVDVEMKSRERPWLDMARRYFPPEEVGGLAGLGGDELRDAFLRLWVGKEAALKCLGTGLAGKLERAVCRLDGSRVTGVAVDSRVFSVQPFFVPGDGFGAVAWEGGGRSVRCFQAVW